MVLSPFPVLQTYYMWMNMDDPLIGGYGKEKVALRRAIALGYNSSRGHHADEEGSGLAGRDAAAAECAGLRSPPTAVRSPTIRRWPTRCWSATAIARAPTVSAPSPDGKPLTLVMHSESSTVGRLRDELWRKNLSAIGLKVVFKSDKKTEIIKASRLGSVMMFETNWVADFPDGENFYQLLYGPNSGRANYARFNLPAYNQRYEQSRSMGDSPQRTALYGEMAQLIHAYTPWVLLTHPISADLQQPWLKHYRRHPVELTNWRYLDVDAHNPR